MINHLEPTIKTAFDTLETPYTATYEDTQKAYKLMLKVWHPDKHNHDKTLLSKAIDKTTQINEAWNHIHKLLHARAVKKLTAEEVEALQVMAARQRALKPDIKYYEGGSPPVKTAPKNSTAPRSSSIKPFFFLIMVIAALAGGYYLVMEKKVFEPDMVSLSDNVSLHGDSINTKSQSKQMETYREFLRQNPSGPAADKVRKKLAALEDPRQ